MEEEIGEIMAEERAMGAGGEDDVSFMRAFRDAVVDGAREAFDGDEKRAVRLAPRSRCLIKCARRRR